MADESKRRWPRVLLWSSLAVILIMAGAIAGFVFFAFPSGIAILDNSVVTVMTMMMSDESAYEEPPERPSAMPPPAEEPAPIAPVSDQRSHVIQEGDTLWSIAKNSGLVDSPWEWGTIVMQNRDKFDYAFLAVDSGDWKVVMETGKELNVDPDLDPPSHGSEKKFAVQLISLPPAQGAKARRIVQMLLAEDIYAFTYLSTDNGNKVHRIRSGFYDTELEAKAAADRIRGMHSEDGIFPDEFWITISSNRELNGELFAYGAQRIRPWTVEMPIRSSHGAALEDLRDAYDLNYFGYIAQKKGQSTARYLYTARIGFFATENEALDMIDENRDAIPQLDEAQAVDLKTFAESLPGQRFKNLGSGS